MKKTNNLTDELVTKSEFKREIKSIDNRMDRFFDGQLELKQDVKHLKKSMDQVLKSIDSIFKFIKDQQEERTILASGH